MTDWNFYQANVNESIASIYLDLHFNQIAPIADYPKSAWYWIKMENPRDDGLSSDEDFDDLYVHEDELEAHLKKFDVKYVGRITTAGRREFYFYLPEDLSINDVLREFVGEEPKFLYQIGEQEDKDWGRYFNVLYPGPNGIKQISARNA